ncbi:GNAT family N-acetyltransferase [Actinomadura algeriensis]|uniref:GNAT superfamily N-acetyltransferase n=1 Tax=Actinomadura algeriensis TaxID=1679523 RepID=A0ABR9JVT6_9ACTN|nr:GNAT family N-acetyltransferase [Actinomadura algeriensis]MBE1534668.1 GNAT superfamily N-acetyltransferase [Actinomadura algeriensis]
MDTDTGTRQRRRVHPAGYRIRLARTDELGVVLGLIDGAAAWLRAEKPATRQWNRPWPDPDGRSKRVYEGLLHAETWLLFDGASPRGSAPIGTVTIRLTGHEELWTARERRVDAVYLHRLVIERGHAGIGLGAELIDWAGRKGRSALPTANLIRIDVWSDNAELHGYYKERGFQHIATRTTSDRSPSGAVFEKPIAPEPAVPRIHEDAAAPRRP